MFWGRGPDQHGLIYKNARTEAVRQEQLESNLGKFCLGIRNVFELFDLWVIDKGAKHDLVTWDVTDLLPENRLISVRRMLS